MTSTQVTSLFLARHGQSESNNQSRVTGQLNPGLSPNGQQQSEALARCLDGEELAPRMRSNNCCSSTTGNAS